MSSRLRALFYFAGGFMLRALSVGIRLLPSRVIPARNARRVLTTMLLWGGVVVALVLAVIVVALYLSQFEMYRH